MPHTHSEPALLLALESPKLDESDFILLASKLLAIKLDDDEHHPIVARQIQRQYLEQKYKEAIADILKCCQEHETLLGASLVQRLSMKAAQLSSSPPNNDSRRFYEGLYAEHLERVLIENFDCALYNELNEAYNAVRPEYTVNELTQINNFAQARQLVLGFVMLNDNVELGLKAQSPLYQQKDRSREELGQVLTANPGIMRPNAPNFADKLIPVKKIDKIAIAENKVNGYSKTNPSVPFVASLSGTTYSLVVVLQNYIENHKTDPELEKKINHIVMLWTSAYIKDGYHSYKEVIDIFKDQYIQSIFATANIKLDYALLDDSADEFQQAQAYTLAIATKNMMHQELQQKVQEKNQRAEQQKTIIQQCGELINQLNQDAPSKEKYPQQLQALADLYQKWLAGSKKSQEFKQECTLISSEMKTKEEKIPVSFTSILRNIKDFFTRLYTSGFTKKIFTPTPSLITQLNDALAQIPTTATAKNTPPLRNKASEQEQEPEIRHFPSPIKTTSSQNDEITTKLQDESTPIPPTKTF